MKLAEALLLHAELRQSGRWSSSWMQAVIELHAPDEGTYAPRTYAECAGCDAGIHAESGIDWPCRTVLLINRWARIDAIGYPE